MHRLPIAILLSFSSLALAAEHPLFLEVHNAGPRRFQHVVEHRAPLAELFPDRQPLAVRVVETDAAGRRLRDGIGQFDRESGGQAVVSLLLDGVAEPGQRRWFRVEAADQQPAAPTDLRLDEAGEDWLVSTQFFTAHVARRGRGGFPDTVEMNGSGSVYRDFFYGDRVYAKEKGSLHLRDDGESATRIVSRGPLRIVLETAARYGPTDRRASGDARAVYRWTYRAYSPVVDVACKAARSDAFAWSEIHFLQISRKDTLLGRWVGGEPLRKGGFTNSKASTTFPRWGVMHNADDAVGLAFPGGVMLYDGIDYVNYLQTPVPPWAEPAFERAGRLYFGPALRDPTRYAQWLTGDAGITTRRAPLPKAAAPVVKAKYRHASKALALEFADEARGMGLVRLTNRLAKQTLVEATDEKPLLWRIELRAKEPKLKPVILDNRIQAARSAKASEGELVLQWSGIALPEEPAALTVTVTVELTPDAALSSWRIKADNRSTRYGVWDVLFPAFAGVGAGERPDVAVPRSNWGMLYREGKHRQTGQYPSANWPMQFLTVNRGDAGLYLACHDPEAWPKQFSLTPMGEFHFRVHAPNQGVPGTDFEMPFPTIVVGVYQGDWWQGAKLYRQWAIANAPWARRGPLATRKDVPKKLLDLGLWFLGSGHPKDVVPRMKQAAELFRVPIGIHWYNWHQIPFDTYYPNYFPTKPGVPEAVKELTDAGMVVMPYINGRLWDTGNDNFKQAMPFACKDAKGEPYIEVYGSKRKLAPMCPHTPFWQEKVQEICRRLMTETGVNAIYLDQIAAAGPRLCHDKTHGHRLGGGAWWVDGYRTMLEPIRKFAHADGRDVILTTENNAEPYMDTVDCLLTWNPRFDNEIPMVTAVYSGYTTYFASPSRVSDSLTAFAMSQGRDFLFGCQPGWMGFELLEKQNREKARYLDDLAAHRLAARDFMHLGELLGEIKPLNDIPSVEVTWGRGWGSQPPHKAVLPAVMATLWRAPDGRLAIAATNWDDRPHLFRYDPTMLWPDGTKLGGVGGAKGRPDHIVYTRLTPTGPVHSGYGLANVVTAGCRLAERVELLASREVVVLAAQRASSPGKVLKEVANQSASFLVGARPPRLWWSIERRCQALSQFLWTSKARDSRKAEWSRRCVAEVLAAQLGIEVEIDFSTPAVAAGRPAEVHFAIANRGRGKVAVRCALGALALLDGEDSELGQGAVDFDFSAKIRPGAAHFDILKVWPPPVGHRSSAQLIVPLRLTLSPKPNGSTLRIPLAFQIVQPFSVTVDVRGAPRAGEALLARANVTNHTSQTASPTLMFQAPEDWEVMPGRRLRLPRLQPDETRSVVFRCVPPRDAIAGRTRLSASVSIADDAAHINVQPPRPQTRAPHRNGAPAIDGDLADWRAFAPAVVDGGRHVQIEDWKGKGDCSAKVWTGWDERHLFVAAEVTDDVFDQKQRDHAIWQGDCIQMALCPGPPRSESGYGGVLEFGLALTPEGPQVWQWLPQARETAGAKLVVKQAKGKLLYEAAIPWAALGSWRPAAGSSLGWSFTVNDADGDGFRGWLEWTPGICGTKSAAPFGRLVLEKR